MVEGYGKTTDNGSHDSGIRAGKQVTLAHLIAKSSERSPQLPAGCGPAIGILTYHAERSIDYRLRYRHQIRRGGRLVFLTALPARVVLTGDASAVGNTRPQAGNAHAAER